MVISTSSYALEDAAFGYGIPLPFSCSAGFEMCFGDSFDGVEPITERFPRSISQLCPSKFVALERKIIPKLCSLSGGL